MTEEKITSAEIITSPNSSANHRTKVIRIAVLSTGALLIILTVFSLGVVVGFKKASFSYKWGENYERNFGRLPMHLDRPDSFGPEGMMPNFMNRLERKDLRNAHGLAGKIISLTDNQLLVQDRNGQENTVNVTDKTIIKMRMNDLKISDLKKDQEVVVMGKPAENGVLTADLIRVFETITNE